MAKTNWKYLNLANYNDDINPVPISTYNIII